MESSLEHLVTEGVVSEVIGRLKSGKEADVYVVRYGGQIVAAKVYKDRAHRSFKNNAVYKEGRSVRNSRSQRAMDRGSKFGKDASEDAWKAAEAATLYKLHAAGVRVPTPVLFLEGVLFMELVRGADGEAAPRLIDVNLTPSQAHAAYMDMLSQLARILSCDLIHGDLSPYNVLWSAYGPTIIDFPQIVSASANSNSESFFHRDARNILGHFVALDPSLRARGGDAREIWRAYVRRELTPDFLPSGRPPAPEPRPRGPEPRPQTGDRGPRQGPHQNRNDGGRPRGPNDGRAGAGRPNDGRTGGRPNDASPRGPQNRNDGGRPRGPNDRRPDHSRQQGARRPSTPEVIVMTRRAPQPDVPRDPPAKPDLTPEASRPERRGPHRPRGRT